MKKLLIFSVMSLFWLGASQTVYAQEDFDEEFDEEEDEDLFSDDSEEGEEEEGDIEGEAEGSDSAGPGNIGIGVQAHLGSSIAGSPGLGGILRAPVTIQAEYFMDDLMINATLDLDYQSPDGADSSFLIGIGAGAFYPMIRRPGVTLYLGGRLHYQGYSQLVGAGTINSNGIYLEAPARFQIEVADELAFHMETGLVISMFTGDAEGFGFALTETNLLGEMGFTYYF